MATPLKLEVLLGAVDKATAPLKRVEQSSTRAAKALKALREQQQQLNKINRDVSGYRSQSAAMERNALRIRHINEKLKEQKEQLEAARTAQKAQSSALKEARADYQRLSDQYSQASAAGRGLTQQLERARLRVESANQAVEAARQVTERYSNQVRKTTSQGEQYAKSNKRLADNLVILEGKLKDAGVDMTRLRDATQSMKTRNTQLTSSIAKQREQLDKLRQSQERVNKVREKWAGVRNGAAVAGMGATLAGAGALRGVYAPITESKRYQNEIARIDALGQGQQTTNEAINYAHTHQGYGISERDTLTLVRDALSIFGSEEHAESVAPVLQKMQFANRARYGEEQGEENERIFMDMLKAIELRGGVNDPAEFKKQSNMIQQIINATGGRVNADEWLQVIKTGGIAVKGLDDEAFFYKLEPLIQEMGGGRVGTGLMSTYQNLYQGRTTKTAVHSLERLGLVGDKSKVSYDKVGQQAFLGPGALLKGDLFKKDMFGWVDTVLIPQLQKAGITSQQGIMDAVGSIITNRTGSAVISGYIMQQQANQRRAGLNAKADGIDAMSDKAKDQAQGKELELAARRADLYKRMGDSILPAYSKALEIATNVLATLTGWMERNPKLAKAMLITLAGFGFVATIFGTIALAMAALMGPMIMLRIGVAMLGSQFSTAMGMARIAVMGLSRVIMANPIGAAITAIAVSAFLIYKYWDPIKAYLINLWEQIKSAFRGGLAGVLSLIIDWSPVGAFYEALAGVLRLFGVELPAKMSTWGSDMINSLWQGLMNKLPWLRDKIDSVKKYLPKWMVGEEVAQPAEQQRRPLIFKQDRRLAGMTAGIVNHAGAIVEQSNAIQFDKQAPVSTQPTGATSTDNRHYIFQIHGGNADPQEIARHVRTEFDRRDNEHQARQRSSLTDRG